MPRLIDTVGELSTTFDLNGQEVHNSCGVTFQNEHFIFGGDQKKRQILKVNQCGLISIGSTPFDHFRGACGSTDDVILLCFNEEDGGEDAKRCRKASTPKGPWTQIQFSIYEHRAQQSANSPGTNYLI